MKIDEEWRDIEGYEGYYQISDHGRVKSLKRSFNHNLSNVGVIKEKILKEQISKFGYCVVSVGCDNKKRKTFSVHRLVAIAFILNPKNKRTVNHIDGNKRNNHISNLEWSTHGENIKHSYSIGTRNGQSCQDNHSAKLDNNTVESIIECLSDGFKQYEIAKFYNVSKSTISSISNGRTWSAVTGVSNES